MDEQQVRALVRQAIARHLGPPTDVPAGHGAPAAFDTAAVDRTPAGSGPSTAASVAWTPDEGGQRRTISEAQFVLVRPAGEVECLIEPAVICNHCGYCQCYGH